MATTQKPIKNPLNPQFSIISNNPLGLYQLWQFLPSPLSAGSSCVAKPAGYRLGQGYWINVLIFYKRLQNLPQNNQIKTKDL
jgi:hypothetical protein